MSSGSFPRGWQYAAAPAAGSQAAITIPAVAGVAHVLTSITAQMLSTRTVDAVTQLQVISGALTLFAMELVATAPVAPATNSLGEASWTGELIIPQGQAVTVQFNIGASAITELLIVQGYEL